MNSEPIIRQIDHMTGDYWKSRISSQLHYLLQVGMSEKHALRSDIIKVAENLASRATKEGAVTRTLVLEAEQALADIPGVVERAKRYTLLLAGHAHIDMNWLWGWHETAALTVETVHTLLRLMEELPDFVFSQSQAAVYQILERYAPTLLDQVRHRINEGRWEVTATQWVEPDMNMPSGESQVRQLMEAKRYLTDLLGLAENSLDIAYLPDSFGHAATIPEIMVDGGVRYLYHCRGAADSHIYRWEAPSGRSLLAYREPRWYNEVVEPSMLKLVPDFCRAYNTSFALAVFGVGDHGGGPTIRDIQTARDMATWPVGPRIEFSSYRNFFTRLENEARDIPVVRGSRNAIFTGCYTSQSRIKRANKVSERSLYEAGLYATLARIVTRGGMGAIGTTTSAASALQDHGDTDSVLRRTALQEGWRRTLFNQFHDILPGTGIPDTREHALGSFQEAMAHALTVRNRALRVIAEHMAEPSASRSEHSERERPDSVHGWDTAVGAGPGFGAATFRAEPVGRDRGTIRLFRVFNSMAVQRYEAVEFTLWDWPADPALLEFVDESGTVLPHQVVEERSFYWSHHYTKVYVLVSVPGLGYTSVVARERTDPAVPDSTFHYHGVEEWLIETPRSLVLENRHLRAEFHEETLSLIGLLDKASGIDLINADTAGARMVLIDEEAKRMSSWLVGRHREQQGLVSRQGEAKLARSKSGLVSTLEYKLHVRDSEVRVTWRLTEGISRLDVRVEAEWREIGQESQSIPQLAFTVPVGYASKYYANDIPIGFETRGEMNQDFPAQSFVAAIPADGGSHSAAGAAGSSASPTLALASAGTYGYRVQDGLLTASLLRSSVDPDAYPEIGNRSFELSLLVTPTADLRSIHREVTRFLHPLQAISHRPTGSAPPTLPASHSFIELTAGTVVLTAVDLVDSAPNGTSGANTERQGEAAVLLRLFETDGVATTARLQCAFPVADARVESILGEEAPDAAASVEKENSVVVSIPAHRHVTLRLSLG